MPGIASSATSILIGHIASNYIKSGSGGIMLPNHAPLIVKFGTLATFPNRIDLGLGRSRNRSIYGSSLEKR
jgi:alkanesulfonate monooxygenase SsuD/methylene tetrahydromethanopterin reductase-like flavin-dependent oxidoreductase (luciferase family)